MLELLKAVDGRVHNFAGIKYTFESLFEYSLCHRYQNGKFDILHGQDETLLASLALGGAQGCIGGTFNYAAGLYVKIRHAYAKGRSSTGPTNSSKSHGISSKSSAVTAATLWQVNKSCGY